jgi:hypothetical protein
MKNIYWEAIPKRQLGQHLTLPKPLRGCFVLAQMSVPVPTGSAAAVSKGLTQPQGKGAAYQRAKGQRGLGREERFSKKLRNESYY